MIYIFLFLIEIVVLYFLSRNLTKNLTRVFYNLTRKKNWTVYLLSIFFLPGTFIHEISHFLTALFLLVPVGNIELIPKVDKEMDQNVKLGSVPIAKVDFVRNTLVGIAPIIFGIGIIFAAIFYVISKSLFSNVWVTLGVAFLSFQVGNTMFLSKKDLEGSWVFLVFLAFLFTIFYLVGIRIDIATNSFLSETFVEIVKKADIFFLVPIFIDTLFLLILFQFSRRTAR